IASLLNPFSWHASNFSQIVLNQLTNTDAGASPFRWSALMALFEGRIRGGVPIAAFWLLLVVTALTFLAPSSKSSRQWLLPWVGLLVAASMNYRFAPFLVLLCGVTVARYLPLVNPVANENARPLPGILTSRANRIRNG